MNTIQIICRDVNQDQIIPIWLLLEISEYCETAKDWINIALTSVAHYTLIVTPLNTIQKKHKYSKLKIVMKKGLVRKLYYSLPNGDKYGEYRDFNDDGSDRFLGAYINNKPHGKWVKYDEDEDLIGESAWFLGVKHGKFFDVDYKDDGDVYITESQYFWGNLVVFIQHRVAPLPITLVCYEPYDLITGKAKLKEWIC